MMLFHFIGARNFEANMLQKFGAEQSLAMLEK